MKRTIPKRLLGALLALCLALTLVPVLPLPAQAAEEKEAWVTLVKPDLIRVEWELTPKAHYRLQLISHTTGKQTTYTYEKGTSYINLKFLEPETKYTIKITGVETVPNPAFVGYQTPADPPEYLYYYYPYTELTVTTGKKNDTTAPTKPVITVGTVTKTSISFSWTKATDDYTAASEIMYTAHIMAGTHGAKEPPSSRPTRGLTSYTFTGLDPGIPYEVYVDVYDNSGNSNRTERMLVYTVAPDLPVITRQPQSQTLAPGEDLTLTVAAEGAKTYIWQSTLGGSRWADLRSGDQPEITLKDVSGDMNGWRFRCQISNDEGSVTSAEAVLTLTTDYDIEITGLDAPVLGALPGTSADSTKVYAVRG
jgi:hypothetical protein